MTKLIAKNPQKAVLKPSGYSPSGGSDFEITLINSQTVPESVNWGNSIPTTYSGRTGKIPEVALWQTEDEAFWYLSSIENDLYFWKKVPNSADILRILSSIPTSLSQLDNDAGFITIDEVLAEGFAYKNELDEAALLLRKELPFIINAFWESSGNIIDGPPIRDIVDLCYDDVKKTLVRPIHIYVRNISDSTIIDVLLDIFQPLPNNKIFISAHTIDSVNRKVNVYSKVLDITEDYFELDFSYELLADKKSIFFERPKGIWSNNSTPPTHDNGTEYEEGDLFFYEGMLFKFYTVRNIPIFGKLNWYQRIGSNHFVLNNYPDRYTPPNRESAVYTNTYYIGDELYVFSSSASNEFGVLKRIFRCIVLSLQGTSGNYYYSYVWKEIPLETYSKTEINSMIPTVPTNISAFTNDSGYLTLETLPIYDGTVI